MTARVTLERPWLEMRLTQPMQVLSWVLNRPGFIHADRILWREVRNADLPRELDVDTWLAGELTAKQASDAPCFLTSRNITRFVEARAAVEGVEAHAVITLGLSNAERVGTRMAYDGDCWGTINIAVECSLRLSQPAMLEAMSIITQARTAALVEHGPRIGTGQVTGTGTDCIALAAPVGTERFAGLHTPQAEAIGQATYTAISQATQSWIEENSHGT
ncbi:adenosylcobinamide amidohydrolase [Aliiroseovarius sp.]|uniref:adenosylcobinamide amidohydrolase n=1 Tax=Aliiroseovarius sp. TaxID=1872442 RepID=UPI003BAA025E